MDLTKLLISGANASVVVFVVSSTLAVGLALTVQQILAPLRNGRLVALSLLANFVVGPVVAMGLARVFGLDEPLGVGLLLVGVAAGAPFLLKLADLSKGNMPFAVGLMVVLMVITVGYMPIVLPALLEGVSVNPANIARSLIFAHAHSARHRTRGQGVASAGCCSRQSIRGAGVEHQHDLRHRADDGGPFQKHAEHSWFVRHPGGRDLCRHLLCHWLGAWRPGC